MNIYYSTSNTEWTITDFGIRESLTGTPLIDGQEIGERTVTGQSLKEIVEDLGDTTHYSSSKI